MSKRAEITEAVERRTIRVVEACDILVDELNDRIDALSAMLRHVGVTNEMQVRCLYAADPVAELQQIAQEVTSGTYKP